MALSLLATAVGQCRQRPPDLSTWDEARLARELETPGFKTAHVDDGVTPGGRFTLAGRYFARPAGPLAPRLAPGPENAPPVLADPGLARVVAAWPDLPAHIKAAVLALVGVAR